MAPQHYLQQLSVPPQHSTELRCHLCPHGAWDVGRPHIAGPTDGLCPTHGLCLGCLFSFWAPIAVAGGLWGWGLRVAMGLRVDVGLRVAMRLKVVVGLKVSVELRVNVGLRVAMGLRLWH